MHVDPALGEARADLGQPLARLRQVELAGHDELRLAPARRKGQQATG